MKARRRFVLALLCCFLFRAAAQSPPPGPAFEVASIKPTATTDGSLTFDFPPGGRFSARNLTLKLLLQIAYKLQDYQVSGGPGWISSAGFDIQAAAAAGAAEPSRDQVLQMLQSLLTERFQLALRRETRQLPVYALTVGKSGPRLQPAGGDARQQKTMMGQIITRKMSMTNLANILAFDVKRPVEDRTALSGDFAFTLEWAPGLGESDPRADAGQSSRPSLFTALQEQLGLKLEATQAPIEVLVIDHVEKPSEN